MDRIAQFYKVSKEQWSQEVPGAAGYDDIKLPQRATAGSAGYDFYSTMTFRLAPGESIKVPTGIRCRMDIGWVLLIFPRSGLGFKYQMGFANEIPVIDQDYFSSSNEGHIMLKIVNRGDKILDIEAGQAFAQGILLPFGITTDDNTTTIRDGGFGSTDKKES